MNKPYVKVYENGILSNPIEKEFKSQFPNRSQRRQKQIRLFNNRNTYPTKVTSYQVPNDNGQIETRFDKLHVRQQLLKGNFARKGARKDFKTIVHYN